MEFILDHLGYILGTFAAGTAFGWATFDAVYSKVVKPLWNEKRR